MSVDRCQLFVEGRGKPNDFREISFHRVYSCPCKVSKSLGCIRKIPLNPPLQKGEAVGMPELGSYGALYT